MAAASWARRGAGPSNRRTEPTCSCWASCSRCSHQASRGLSRTPRSPSVESGPGAARAGGAGWRRRPRRLAGARPGDTPKAGSIPPIVGSARTPAAGLRSRVRAVARSWRTDPRSEPLPLRFGRVGAAEIVAQLEPARGGVVDQHRHMRVVLQDRRGPHGAHRALDELMDRVGLGTARGDEHDMTCRHDRGKPLGQAVMRNRVDVVCEEARVVGPGLLGEGLDAGARGQRGAWLVEAHVPVGPDAQDLQIDPAGRGDCVFVGCARTQNVDCKPIGTADRARSKVHPLDDLVLDDVEVALGMITRKADILIEGEGLGHGERQTLLVVEPGELVVDRQRARTGRETEHRVRSREQQLLDRCGGKPRELVGCCNNSFHLVTIPSCRSRSRKKRSWQAGMGRLRYWPYERSACERTILPARRTWTTRSSASVVTTSALSPASRPPTRESPSTVAGVLDAARTASTSLTPPATVVRTTSSR